MNREESEQRREKLRDLSRREITLNIARHVASLYIPASILVKGLSRRENPIDYIIEQGPVNMGIAILGFGAMTVGAMIKSGNDGEHLEQMYKDRENGEEPRLLREGMYEHTRHPCYLGQSLITAGLGLISPTFDTAVALLTYYGLTRKNAQVEEDKNSIQFGEEYNDYKARVPRWPTMRSFPKIMGKALEHLSDNGVRH